MDVVVVRDLTRVYRRAQKAPGLASALRSIVRRDVERIEALKGISLSVSEGEIVGVVGPNGAGKTTLLKIVAGVLHPTSGSVRVLNHIPQKRERDFLSAITFVMTGRGFLEEIAWDLCVLDGIRIVKELYRIPGREYENTLGELVEMLELGAFLRAPLRQLSHGQRLRAELAAALLWCPKLLLLDEPTLGLDIMTQSAVWTFIRMYARKHNATVIVTSHYMRDIEELADRLVLIQHGTVHYDGPLRSLPAVLSAERRVRVQFARQVSPDELVGFGGEAFASEDGYFELRVPSQRVGEMVARLLASFPVLDLSVNEPPLEDLLREYFSGRQ